MNTNNKITRRWFLEKSAMTGMATFLGSMGIYGREKGLTENPGLAKDVLNQKSIDQLPSGFRSIVNDVLLMNVGFWNTDWYGTMLIDSLLGWKDRGIPEALSYAENWLDFHIKNGKKLTDDEFYDTYSGPRSRIICGKYLPFSMYSGFFGLPFPCYTLYTETGDERAKQVCLDVAHAILHFSARNANGLVLHDDGVNNGEIVQFTIPDTLYFVAKALMIASVLDDKNGKVYQDQALYQTKISTSFYLDDEKNISRTVLYPTGVGKTFWCRASGWLCYALTGVLRFLPADHPEYDNITNDLKRLADGVKKYQGQKGGLHVLVDQPDTPEEITGTAMSIASIKEAVIKGWLPDEYDEFLEKGWEFVKSHVSDDGKITAVYVGWAVSAEREMIIMDQPRKAEAGWIQAVILQAANMMTAT